MSERAPVTQSTRFPLVSVVPFVPAVLGVALAAWRFRVNDGFGGLAYGLGGMVLLVVLAIRLSPRG